VHNLLASADLPISGFYTTSEGERRPRIDWDQVRRFTPELYALYSTAEPWETDGFNDENEYRAYWCMTVRSLVQSSKQHISQWQQAGKETARAMEISQTPTTQIFQSGDLVAATPLPIAISMVYERVALQASNPPKPMVVAQQESQNQQVAGLNALMHMVLEDNDYDALVAKGFYDIQFWNTCIFRWSVDKYAPGVLGNPGKITLEKLNIADVFWDPTCDTLHTTKMDYVVQRHRMEVGEIQSQYPLAGVKVPTEAYEVTDSMATLPSNNHDVIQSPVPKLARDIAARRQRIDVFEAWIRDSRMKFEPKVLDGTSEDFDKRYVMKDGYIVGDWVKRYPTGRMIVVTQQVVLKDLANPFPHGQFPFVFAQGMPAQEPCSAGSAMRIAIVTRKINTLLSDIMCYFNSEIRRPMTTTPGAIMDPAMAQNVSNDCDSIIELSSPQARLERRQAVDVPSSVYSFIQLLQSMLDMVSGSGGVMRGQLEEGDQLSAEAVGALQQFASSRLALEAKFFKVAVKQLGYQLSWLLRAIVKSNIRLTVALPDGTNQVVDWKSDKEVFDSGDPVKVQHLRATEDYMIDFKPGTGSPGAQAQRQGYFQQLYQIGLIDREAALDGIEFPNRAAVAQRMRQKELEDISARAAGRGLGVSIGDFLRASDSSKPGAKPKV
jgi:hypothetical protein